MAEVGHEHSVWRDIGLGLLGVVQFLFGLYATRLIKQLDEVSKSTTDNREKILAVEGESKRQAEQATGEIKLLAANMSSMDKTTQIQLNNIGHNVDEIKSQLREYMQQDKQDKNVLLSKMDEISSNIKK